LNGNIAHVSAIDSAEEIRKCQRLLRPFIWQTLKHVKQRKNKQRYDDPKSQIFSEIQLISLS
jgi:hypothetical protein